MTKCPNCKKLQTIIDALAKENSYLADNGYRYQLQCEKYERMIKELEKR